MKKSLSEIIAEWTLNFTISDVPNDVIKDTKMHLIDAIGCAIAATDEPHAVMMRNVFDKMHSYPESTLWGTNEKVSIQDAVIHNGGLIHGLDFDDTHALAITHPSASVVAAAFTIGEYMHASGKQILEASILGYEIIVRLGVAGRGKFHDIGFHPTGIISSFSSVCIAAKLMGATKEEIVNALGLCGSQAAAIQEYLHDGTWNKKLHPGWGIHCALYALALAKEGFLGTRNVFEGSYGFYQTHLGFTDGIAEVFEDLGKRWRTKEIAFKFYPTCHWTHSDMDLLYSIMIEQRASWEDIESIECFIDPRGAGSVVEPPSNKKNPETEYQMRFSLFYAMAAMAVKRKFTLKEINLDMMNDKSIREMIERVKITIDPAAEVKGHFPGRIKVTFKNGKVVHKSQPYETGCLENPAETENIINKFINNVEYISEENCYCIIQYIENIEGKESIDELIRLISWK